MDTRIEPINDIAHYLTAQATKPLLRFITCGSVDDGKSSLIGRMLYESKQIFDDQLGALESESKRYGTQGERIDFALLVDGLQAEREQGITIDAVSYTHLDVYKRQECDRFWWSEAVADGSLRRSGRQYAESETLIAGEFRATLHLRSVSERLRRPVG